MQCRSMQFLSGSQMNHGRIHEMKQVVAKIFRINGRICKTDYNRLRPLK
jgi:hypothetical protein